MKCLCDWPSAYCTCTHVHLQYIPTMNTHIRVSHICKRALNVYKRALHTCKRALFIRRGVLHICKRALQIHMNIQDNRCTPRDANIRALHIRKRALHICRRALHICKSALQIHTDIQCPCVLGASTIHAQQQDANKRAQHVRRRSLFIHTQIFSAHMYWEHLGVEYVYSFCQLSAVKRAHHIRKRA